ncbi:glucose-1-phosphate cytidylyltransferase [Alphaproteobacteria bacterium]|nr:glucose-1-phosphate cytidylyltransferase [Alphaproteobacteria bacterium]
MKVVILAGGFGTRLSEETDSKPKPMIEIGGMPILWHIMKYYSSFGHDDFLILLGFKGYSIKEFFSNYLLHKSDVTIDLSNNKMKIHQSKSEAWKVTLIDTGLYTLTGGRIKRAKDYIGDDDFLLTYGDGLSDVNITKLIEFHKSHGKSITMTSVQPDGRYGALDIANNNIIQSFKEKPKGDGAWINGGFFVCKSKIFDFIENDSTVFEEEPLSDIANQNELVAFKHEGFWECMDTLRDKRKLCELWDSNKAPWKIWKY